MGRKGHGRRDVMEKFSGKKVEDGVKARRRRRLIKKVTSLSLVPQSPKEERGDLKVLRAKETAIQINNPL